MCEGFIGVGRHLPQQVALDVVADEASQNVGGQLGIGHPGHGGEVAGRQLGPPVRDVESAVGRQALQHGVQEPGGRGRAPR